MKSTRSNASSAMRQEWNERARKDAFYYVATWRKDWTVETFLESGEEEYLKLVQPVLDARGGMRCRTHDSELRTPFRVGLRS
jgi:hypothetical protein